MRYILAVILIAGLLVGCDESSTTQALPTPIPTSDPIPTPTSEPTAMPTTATSPPTSPPDSTEPTKTADPSPSDSAAAEHISNAVSLSKAGDHEAAIVEWTLAIRLDPEDSRAYLGRGWSYGVLGQNDRAIQDFDEAIRLDPKNVHAYYNRGALYSHLGQIQRGNQDYCEAFRLRGLKRQNICLEKTANQNLGEARPS